MQCSTFDHSLRCLAHPISLSAIVLLILNDHYLKWQYGSWLTGKLSDVAWLVFAPLMVAALLTWMIPSSIPNHQQVVGRVAWIGVGVLFGLAKTIPIANDLTREVQALLLGVPEVDMRRDPTDLIALPALGVSLWLWSHLQAKSTISFAKMYRPMVLTCAVLATCATSPPPEDYGIHCIFSHNRDLYATGIEQQAYSSTDGGLTWTATPNFYMGRQHLSQAEFDAIYAQCNQLDRRNLYGELIDSTDADIRYRFIAGDAVTRSIDGGETWVEEINFSSLKTEVRSVFHEQHEAGNPLFYGVGPLHGAIDPVTNNVILAMSQDGVLVRTANDGKWQWVTVGNYAYHDVSQPSIAMKVIYRELWSSVVLFLLIFAGFAVFSGALRFIVERLGLFSCYLLFTMVAVLLLLITATLFNPAWSFQAGHHSGDPIQGDYMDWDFMGVFTLFASSLIALFLTTFSLSLYIFRKDRLLGIFAFLIAVPSAIAFPIPYILWTQNIVPLYINAFYISFGSVMGIAGIGYGYAAYRFFKRWATQ